MSPTAAGRARAKCDLTLRTACCWLMVLANWCFHFTRMEKTEAQEVW